MKLPDFEFHSVFKELLAKMGADKISIGHDSEWQRITIQLQQKGIDVTLDEITTCDDRTFEFKGQKVLIYIRDQYSKYMSSGGYKFHISHCNTYDGMIKKKRHSRYVVSNRKDGQFVVNVIEKNELVEEGLELKLHVCQNCIKTLSLDVKPNQFNIKEFFDKYSTVIKNIPKHTERTAPINLYAPDWNAVAKIKKEDTKWTCQECEINLEQEAYRRYLHVHHIDHDKSNNQEHNLAVLCITCHSNKSGHERMKYSPEYIRFQAISLEIGC
tara:strand:+ start:9173 stop:9982 length:810 start_codon:yes stop_codon:yes gene_type:complete